MLKISITNDKNQIDDASFFFPTQEEFNIWSDEVSQKRIYGKPERWVFEDQLENQNEDVLLAIDEKTELLMGMDMIEREVKSYKFPATFSFTVEDITVQLLAEKENVEALQYLKDTDWYVIRHSETQVAIPQEILDARAAARLKA